jgi:hypothetical protein
LLKYMMGEGQSKKEVVSAAAPASGPAKRVWSSLLGSIDEAVEAPAGFAERLRIAWPRFERTVEGLLTKGKGRLSSIRRQIVHLLRWYFGLFNFVLMATVLTLLALVPFATYRLGESVAGGRTYYALEPQGGGFWGLGLLAGPRTRPPARRRSRRWGR